MIDFAQPVYLGLVAVLVAMVFAAYRLNRWRASARRDFAGPQSRRWPASASWPRTILLIAAGVLIVLAAARPQWGTSERFREREGVDFVIALDISKSMEGADVQPSRLAVAQDELVQLVEAERGSRIGLVFFAGSAFLRSPLTSDTQAMVQLIRRANQEIGLTRVGSDLGAALDVAAVILAGGEENRGKAVIIVSDGEDFAGTFAAKAAELQEKGIAVHAAGVGTAQGAGLFDRAPNGSQVPHLDANGRAVVTRLNEATLRTIADAGGGNYHLIGPTNDTLLDLRVDLRRLDPTPIGDERQILPIERYQLFTGAALVLLVASWFLPARLALPAFTRARRLRPHPGLALLVAALIGGACGSSDSLSDRNRAANDLFASGDYEGALTAYQELLAERPDVVELSYNSGNALHRLENYERAIAETQRGLPPDEVDLGVATYFALGNHLLHLGRFEEAYQAYRAALLLDPTDQDSKFNLEITLLALNGEVEPGDANNQGQGEGTPQPGEGTPQPGEGTPQPGGEGTPQAGGSPQPSGGQGTPNPTPGNAESLQRTLEEALAGIDEELTFEEAIAILDLLRQQQQTPRGDGSGGTGPDY
ncbi:MAG TPA: VWA domain-containing protein [Dehalococcoidia bacterium]|nr:VWA domain-containing protein [Dehalococcoidia bacterium]